MKAYEHLEMKGEIVCTKYNSACRLPAKTCAKRYQKATFNPEDGSLDPCRKCDEGKKNFGEWKESFSTQPAQKKFSDHPNFVSTKPYICRFCETPTTSTDRICLKCQIEGKKTEEKYENCRGLVPAPSDRKEEVMGGVTSSKVCVDCKQEYKPTSNVQKRCMECAKKHKISVDRERRERIREKPQVSRERVPRQSKAASPQGNIGPDGGRETEPETYTITVDFTRFPKLHQRLTAMANEEIRNPGDQLLFMLKNTLGEMEARV
ncbi:MAG: hypothetical protein AB1423_14365 [Pseudomonadota bacterium]